MTFTLEILLTLILSFTFYSQNSDGKNLLDVEISRQVEKSNIPSGFQRYPIILLPGLGGSKIEMKFKTPEEEKPKKKTPGFWCSSKTPSWRPLWISFKELLRWPCFLHSMELNFDEENGFYNNEGVEHRIVDYGGTDGLDYLHPVFSWASRIYGPFIEYFEKNLGYKRGFDIRGAPYDFVSTSPIEWEQKEFPDLKKLIEETYENTQLPVVLAGHSLGGRFAQLFLSAYVSKEWKEKYIRQFISLAGSHDGSIEVLDIILTGWYSPLPVNIKRIVKRIAGVLQSIPTTYHQDEVVVRTDTKEYRLSNFSSFFHDMGDDVAANAFEYLKRFNGTIDPGVETTCMFGNNIRTPRSYWVDDIVNTKKIKVLSYFEDGDGTLFPDTWKICDNWEKSNVVLFDGSKYAKRGDNFHRFIIADDDVMKAVEKLILSL